VETTLDIAGDVLAAVKAIARQQGKTVGAVLTELARAALLDRGLMTARSGVPLLKIQRPKAVVTLKIVNKLRDEAP
jgi:hypothetical protein